VRKLVGSVFLVFVMLFWFGLSPNLEEGRINSFVFFVACTGFTNWAAGRLVDMINQSSAPINQVLRKKISRSKRN